MADEGWGGGGGGGGGVWRLVAGTFLNFFSLTFSLHDFLGIF